MVKGYVSVARYIDRQQTGYRGRLKAEAIRRLQDVNANSSEMMHKTEPTSKEKRIATG